MKRNTVRIVLPPTGRDRENIVPGDRSQRQKVASCREFHIYEASRNMGGCRGLGEDGEGSPGSRYRLWFRGDDDVLKLDADAGCTML